MPPHPPGSVRWGLATVPERRHRRRRLHASSSRQALTGSPSVMHGTIFFLSNQADFGKGGGSDWVSIGGSGGKFLHGTGILLVRHADKKYCNL
jgi:hypothetical protein